MKLAKLQDAFQSAILGEDTAILDIIPDSPKEKREELFGVYRNAYMLRLIEILTSDYEQLAKLIGEDEFEQLARDYFAANPSRHRSARWVGTKLPEFLKADPRYAKKPVLADLAALEDVLNFVFDCEDMPVLAVADLAKVAPEQWQDLVFEPHPAVRLLDLKTNAAAVWVALNGGKRAPKPKKLVAVEHQMIWRHGTTPKFRALQDEEHMLWREAVKGVRFGVLCELAAAFDDPDNAALRTAGYLRNWVEGGLLSGFRLKNRNAVKKSDRPK